MNVGDEIDSLPADNSQLSAPEMALIHSYFQPVQQQVAPAESVKPDSVKAITPLQEYLFLFIAFVLISLPSVDEYIAEKVPSVYSRLCVKGAVLTLSFFIVANRASK